MMKHQNFAINLNLMAFFRHSGIDQLGIKCELAKFFKTPLMKTKTKTYERCRLIDIDKTRQTGIKDKTSKKRRKKNHQSVKSVKYCKGQSIIIEFE